MDQARSISRPTQGSPLPAATLKASVGCSTMQGVTSQSDEPLELEESTAGAGARSSGWRTVTKKQRRSRRWLNWTKEGTPTRGMNCGRERQVRMAAGRKAVLQGIPASSEPLKLLENMTPRTGGGWSAQALIWCHACVAAHNL